MKLIQKDKVRNREIVDNEIHIMMRDLVTTQQDLAFNNDMIRDFPTELIKLEFYYDVNSTRNSV